MVVCFFVAALIALFPVFLYADIYADPSQNRLWFAVSLYHRVKLFGGYAELRGGGTVFHIAKHKAVFLRFARGEYADARLRELIHRAVRA